MRNFRLSVHATQEWYDLYTEERTKDLQKFLDHYLKNVENGWEETPRVRYSLLQFNKESIVNKPYPDLPWKLPTSVQQRLFLTPDGKLSNKMAGSRGKVSYQADVVSKLLGPEPCDACFTHVFSKKTMIAGPSTVILHVASPKHNDLDIYVQLRKADKDGNLLEYSNIPLADLGLNSVAEVPQHNVMKHLGPQGMLRASKRHVSQELSGKRTSWKTLSHSQEESFTPGQILRLEIQLWPTGMVFDAGEQILLYVSGHYLILPEFDEMPPYHNCNKGEHIIYAGGDYDSSLLFYEIQG